MIQRFQSKSMPFVLGDFIYFQGIDDRVWKVDINTGNADDNFNPNGVWRSSSSLFVSGGFAYFRGTDKTKDNTDYRIWKVDTTTGKADDNFNPRGVWQSDSSPFVSGDFVYFQGVDGRVWKVNINTSVADDSFNASGVWRSSSSPFVAGNFVYFRGTDKPKDNTDYRIWKVDINTGKADDKFNPNGVWKSNSSPFVSGDFVYFQGVDGRVWKVNINTSVADGSFNASGVWRSNSSPYVSGDFVYFQGTDNRVWKVDINIGKADDNFNPDGSWKSASSPFVSGDNIYFQGTNIKGSDDNTLFLERVSPLVWMKDVSDDKFLSELSIPGSHDSAALYDIPLLPSYNAKDQFESLSAQLNFGVRFFDIRLRFDNNKLEAWHGQTPVFNKDQNIGFDDVVEICSNFLKRYPKECIIMSIQQEGNDVMLMNVPLSSPLPFGPASVPVPVIDTTDIGPLVEQKINQNPNLWYTDKSIPTIGNVRGKIVLLRRFALKDKDSLGIDVTGWQDKNADFSISVSNGSLRIQDLYESPGNKSEAQASKWNAVKKMLDISGADHNNQTNITWYVNFTSAVYGTIPSSMDIAEYINPSLYSYFANKTKVEIADYSKTGIVVIDFVDAKLAQKIIALNW